MESTRYYHETLGRVVIDERGAFVPIKDDDKCYATTVFIGSELPPPDADEETYADDGHQYEDDE